jgi:hypothetical protein
VLVHLAEHCIRFSADSLPTPTPTPTATARQYSLPIIIIIIIHCLDHNLPYKSLSDLIRFLILWISQQ